MKKAFIIFASLMLCIIILFGCGPAEETTTTTTKPPTSTTVVTTTTPPTSATTTTSVARSVLGCPQGDPDLSLTPQFGGTLKVIMPSGPSNIGVTWAGSRPTDSQFQRFCVESLIGLGPNGETLPQLATSWTADQANKTLTLTLRSGVKFHDGTVFDAEAVRWNLQQQIDIYKRPELLNIVKMEVLDATHLKISYSSWEALTISYLASNVAGRMVSPTNAKKYIAEGKEKELQLYPVGTGPFKLVEFKSNVSMKVTRFEDYWQKPLPYLDNVEINIVADSVVALTSFLKGEAHVIGGLSTKDAKDLKSQGYLVSQYTANIFGFCGDSKNADSSWANMDIRKAVAYAINRDVIVNDVYDGMFPVAHQLALPGRTAYDSSIQGYPYDLAKAKALLEPLGITPATPLTTKFIYELNAQKTDLWTAVQADLAKVGINIELSPLDAASFRKFYAAPWTNSWVDYDMSYNGLSLKYMTSLTWSLSYKQNRDVSVWTPDAYNALYDKMLVETDPNKLEDYYKALNKMAVDDYCLVVPVASLQSLFAYVNDAKDIGLGVREAIEFLPERFWVQK